MKADAVRRRLRNASGITLTNHVKEAQRQRINGPKFLSLPLAILPLVRKGRKSMTPHDLLAEQRATWKALWPASDHVQPGSGKQFD